MNKSISIFNRRSNVPSWSCFTDETEWPLAIQLPETEGRPATGQKSGGQIHEMWFSNYKSMNLKIEARVQLFIWRKVWQEFGFQIWHNFELKSEEKKGRIRSRAQPRHAAACRWWKAVKFLTHPRVSYARVSRTSRQAWGVQGITVKVQINTVQ